MKSYCVNSRGNILDADGFDLKQFQANAATIEKQAWRNLEKVLGLKPELIKASEKPMLGHLYRQTNLFSKIDFGQCYIGISGNPLKRAYGHGEVVIDEEVVEAGQYIKKVLITLAKNYWEKMFVIYGGTPANVREMERQLIETLKKNIREQFDSQRFTSLGGIFNRHPGGGGNLGKRSYAFVYVLTP